MSDGTQKQAIPRLIEPRKFAHQGVSLTGFVPVEDMPRVAAVASAKEISAELAFSLGEQRERLLSGHVLVKAEMQCQRCLNMVDVDIDCDVSLAIVRSEDKAKELAKCYEPWVVAEEEADLYAILEEEILLNTPLVVSHEENCIDSNLFTSGSSPDEEEEVNVTNPFQMLKQLKDKTKKSL